MMSDDERESERRKEFFADPIGVMEREGFAIDSSARIDSNVRYVDVDYMSVRDFWLHISPWIIEKMRTLLASEPTKL